MSHYKGGRTTTKVYTDQGPLICKTHGVLSLESQDSPANTTNMTTTLQTQDMKGGPLALETPQILLNPRCRVFFLSFWFLFPRPGLPSPKGMTMVPQMADFQTIEFQTSVVSEQLACNEG